MHPVGSCPDEMIKTQQQPTHDPEGNKEGIKEESTIMAFVVMIAKVYMVAAVDVLIEGHVIPWCLGETTKRPPKVTQPTRKRKRAPMPIFTEEDCMASLQMK
jgi:hypothetical protein